MPITDLLERNAHEFCHETALVEINPEVKEIRRVTWKEYELIESSPTESYRREITWGVFDEKANRCANLLLSRGIKKGDKVAILMMNSLEWLPLYFGILKTGALAVPLNFRYTAEEIKYCLELADVDALFFGPEFIGRVEDICDKIPRVKLRFFIGDGCPRFAENYMHLAANLSSYPPRILLSDDDDAAIYFSSGTTGFPKAILHTHRALMHAAKVEQAHHGQTHDDVFLCIPPLYHTGAKMHWFGSLISGSKGILLKGTDPKTIIETVSNEKCTIVWLLVPWVQDILDAIDDAESTSKTTNSRSGGSCTSARSPCRRASYRDGAASSRATSTTRTTASRNPSAPAASTSHRQHRQGRRDRRPRLRLARQDSEREGRRDHRRSVGELAAKGPGVMKCYYNDPEATDAVLKNGWLLTGDMARQDESGFIYLVDRKKDVIISGGENIYPVQIEDFLRANNAIKDAAVIGLPDKRLGEIAAAIIELKPGAQCTEADIEDFCMALPRYKRPRRIIFADIPRNPTGKIEKPKLRQMYRADNLVARQTNA